MSNYNISKIHDNEKKKFGNRLKLLLDANGETQKKLSEELNVGEQTVSNWVKGYYFPDTDTMLKITAHFKCDLDYLTGRIDESTHDIKFIRLFTGLTEEAIQKIHSPELNNPYGILLSRIIESDYFENFITSYKLFLSLLDQLNSADTERLSAFEIRESGNVLLNTNEAINHFKQQVSLAIVNVCDAEHMTKLSNLERKQEITDQNSLLREINSTKSEIAYLTEYLEFLEKEVSPELKKQGK